MKINLIIFGQLCELLGENLVLEDVSDTDNLKTLLNQRFPGLVGAKYLIAVNKKVITGKTKLMDNSTVALLPPFSGG
ncbi:MAG TPA: MoaD/ThiS family protein [Chitinophagaceae bacterium]|jgi:molybdopterin synthase sulfur carrier subunit